MFFNATTAYCFEHACPITRAFLEAIRKDSSFKLFNEMIIDTRVHMLMPGWFPCIPGYHHDDVPRTRADGQPDYDHAAYRPAHVMGLVHGDICPTEFALGTAEFQAIPGGDVIYKQWHGVVENYLSTGVLERRTAPSNRLIYFNDRTWHQGTRCILSGWRWFARASWDTHRVPTNEIRRQVQVYLEFPMEGW